MKQISTELRACHDCMARLAALYMGMTGGFFINLAGGDTAAAVRLVERGIFDDMVDGQQGEDNPPN